MTICVSLSVLFCFLSLYSAAEGRDGTEAIAGSLIFGIPAIVFAILAVAFK